jgi:hypothetical protein
VNWLFQLHATHPAAHAIGILALVCLGGMALGSVKVQGIGLGTAGVHRGVCVGDLAGRGTFHFGGETCVTSGRLPPLPTTKQTKHQNENHEK